MKCPNCKIALKRVAYEGVNIRSCEQCSGTLVGMDRLKAINARRDKTDQDLMNELVLAGEDSQHKLRCSRCLSVMEKRTKKIGHSQFFIDRCNKCKLVWLDAGELAKWQVVFQFSEKGEEAKRFQDRLNNMTPAERAKYEEMIANLPVENVALDIASGVVAELEFRGVLDLF